MLRDGVLELDLEARLARWEGEGSDLAAGARDPSIITVLGFAEEGGPVTIPGPLIRVPQGTEVRVRVRNSIPDSVSIGLPQPALREAGMSSVAGPVLIVRGLRAGTMPDDTLHVPQGETREVRYRADRPGTYFYWATPSTRVLRTWSGRDASLAGAIIVDPAGTTPDPDERIFVITMLDQLPDSTHPFSRDDLFRRAINGLSWPGTERFHYTIGDTVRWRWINASFSFHPMHLHGFHYRLLARGDGISETILAPDEQPLIVTEQMKPGGTFRMEWVPARAGNWIFHCHNVDHINPVIDRDEAARTHDLHDVRQHALEAMAGLVLGVTISDDGSSAVSTPPHQRLRLVALERRLDQDRVLRGFALGIGSDPVADSFSVPGPRLILTRGETTEITVVNRLSEPSTIHWHGLELESVFDGVAGWSRTGARIAPLIAPGDSFAVRITPPRAGTFIYHTHMDETDQLAQGMAGPFIVLEPGESFDADRDRIFLIGGQAEGDYPVNINGHVDPPPATSRAGTEYRLRFIHITRGTGIDIELAQDSVPVRWRAVAKDGADLPPALRIEGFARLHTDTGETFDFLWTPAHAGNAVLTVGYDLFFERRRVEITQTILIR
ncbi:MAG: multicopper oxidase domain-containing protein [Gemmatimonadetes bacterium]|nr:multicopper oxidase domain-containing protein [Gemmatimonadota bacterium]